MKQYAEITDRGECLATLYTFPQIPWPESFLKHVACREEWSKSDFYPHNGLVAEIPYVISQNISLKIDIDIYILKINETFYVPMTIKGIKLLSESEYRNKRPFNKIQGMDERQSRINDFWT
ncbi:MAG: hypothetical protein PHI48_04075 [Bacteroidales bacterium]|nr:hypothetical protein [Bacteroidales bacterium]